jgi:3-O-methylgallate 3,4-dioxygenase
MRAASMDERRFSANVTPRGRRTAVAEIVFGVASSHTPQLSSGVDMWDDHAERDRRNPRLLGLDYEFHTYDELLETADPGLAEELTPSVWREKYQRGQDAVSILTERLAAAGVDIAVVFGDDQRELFRDEGIPAFGCYLGHQLIDLPPAEEQLARTPAGIKAASWAAHAGEPEPHLTHAELSAHVLDLLIEHDFDMLQFSSQLDGRSLGHAFTFPRYRLGLPATTPMVPIFINTYYAPNVPSARRCYRLGQLVRQAVESWPGDARVAIVASGGLSHFVVDEKLDRKVLASLERRDANGLASLTRKQLRSGTSEILNWVAAAGALDGLAATIVDYVPGYRSPAGTGAGMAFAYWTPDS